MKSIHLIIPYFKENRVFIFLGLVTLIIVDFLQLFIPRIIKWVVDDLTSFNIDHHQLLFYGIYIASIAILIAVLRYIWRYCLIGTSRRIEEGLRNRLFSHIQNLSASYFIQMKTGDLMAHATNDINHIRMASGMGLVAITDAFVLGSAAIGFMMYINIKLTLLALIPMPGIILGSRFFGRKMHKRYQDVQASFANMTEMVRERFAGIRIIKAYNQEKNEIDRVDRISSAYINNNINLVKITASFFPMMLLFSNLSLVIIILMGGRLTIINTITAGDFVAFINYLGLLTWPMMAIGWLTNLIQRGAASLDRINSILETSPDIKDSKDSVSISKSKGEIIFKNVNFSYTSDSRPVLSDINLHIKAGMTLGIVGPPGSGKTTLLNLLPRLYDVKNGQIQMDGIDIRNICLDDLRAQLSFVPQEPFLFAGTIQDNIAFGRKTSDHKDFMKAVKSAVLLPTIESFPDKFETIVGEKGVILSGGQKQRIGIARALFSDAPILIFDDPVSQVDADTSRQLIETIKTWMGLKTIIIVSHRISAVRFADQIIVLKEGRIVSSGSHETLINPQTNQDDYYAQTHRLQEIEEKYNAL
ncbi:multidrug resistance ABC transporter ATP-binding/permease protein [Candidatus Magnetomorum sp. HK-1]|nr:multidrug resistance ABC transporter ATP-binding/permease protein [Candidatus Magnetomorum sp. HK-1]